MEVLNSTKSEIVNDILGMLYYTKNKLRYISDGLETDSQRTTDEIASLRLLAESSGMDTAIRHINVVISDIIGKYQNP